MNAYRPPAGIGCGCRAQGCRPSPTIAYRARSLAQRSCVSLHPVKLISGSGESEPAWISIGEHAWGVFAFGQVARGAVAIGQMAIGLIAVGQLAVGLFAVGQVAASGTWSMAMLGIAGRGLGGVLRVLPKSARDRAPAYRAAVCEYGDLLSGRLAEGYIEVELRLDSDSLPELVVPVALRDLVDASDAKSQIDAAWNEGCMVGVVGVVPERWRVSYGTNPGGTKASRCGYTILASARHTL
jgi:hypothetical protein